jgi:hypothetical protein
MADGFGLSNLVISPFLERVARDERLGQDHPRKPRDQNAKSAKEGGAVSPPPDEDKKAETSVSSQHIDLRI